MANKKRSTVNKENLANVLFIYEKDLLPYIRYLFTYKKDLLSYTKNLRQIATAYSHGENSL